jgi:hypothetical protein
VLELVQLAQGTRSFVRAFVGCGLTRDLDGSSTLHVLLGADAAVGDCLSKVAVIPLVHVRIR